MMVGTGKDMQITHYKGYFIRYHRTTEWLAQIYKAGSNVAIAGTRITATSDEGEQILLARARARIDEEEGGNKET